MAIPKDHSKMTMAKRIEGLENDIATLNAQIQTLESGLFLLQVEVKEIKVEEKDKFGSSGRG